MGVPLNHPRKIDHYFVLKQPSAMGIMTQGISRLQLVRIKEQQDQIRSGSQPSADLHEVIASAAPIGPSTKITKTKVGWFHLRTQGSNIQCSCSISDQRKHPLNIQLTSISEL
jgi:hypothetical protein